MRDLSYDLGVPLPPSALLQMKGKASRIVARSLAEERGEEGGALHGARLLLALKATPLPPLPLPPPPRQSTAGAATILAEINAGIVEGVRSFVAEISDSSPLRPLLSSHLMNSKRAGSRQEQAAATGLSTSAYHRHRALPSGDVLSVLKRVAGHQGHSVERKNDGVRETMIEFWYSMCKQSRRVISATGERSTTYHCLIPCEEVYRKYKNLMTATLIKNEGEEEDGDAAVARIEGRITQQESWSLEYSSIFDISSVEPYCESDDTWDKRINPRDHYERSAFLDGIPADVKVRAVGHFKCPHCITLGHAEDQQERVVKQHLLLHKISSRVNKNLECKGGGRCDLWANVLRTETLTNELYEELCEDIRDGEAHVKIVVGQREEYEKMQRELQEKATTSGFSVLVTIDFSAYEKKYSRDQSMSDSITGTQALHVVVHRLDPSFDSSIPESKTNRQFTIENFDYFAAEPNDTLFVRRALHELMDNASLRGESVAFWSDGGPKHFLNTKSLFFVLVQLKIQYSLLRCVWNFFAPCHGKNGCDGAAGYIKSTLKREAIRGNTKSGPEQYAEVACTLKSHIGVALGNFDRTDSFAAEQVRGKVLKYRCFEHVGSVDKTKTDFTLFCKQLTSDEDSAETNGSLVLRPQTAMDLEQTGKSLSIPTDTPKPPKKKLKAGGDGDEGGSGVGRREEKRREKIAAKSAPGARIKIGYEVAGRKSLKWYTAVVQAKKEKDEGAGEKSYWVLARFEEEGSKDEWVDLAAHVELVKTSS